MSLPVEVVTVAGLVVRIVEVTHEVDAGRVDVMLAIDDGPNVRAAIPEWATKFEAWGAARGEDGKPIGDLPPQPAEFLLALQVTLVDDCGTRYARHSSQAGGSGTQRLGRWSWTPVPPPEATELTLKVAGGRRITLRRAGPHAWVT